MSHYCKVESGNIFYNCIPISLFHTMAGPYLVFALQLPRSGVLSVSPGHSWSVTQTR